LILKNGLSKRTKLIFSSKSSWIRCKGESISKM
jgi:hypothetical protein